MMPGPRLATSGSSDCATLTMGADNGTDFLNSDFPMYAAGGVVIFCGYRAYVVSLPVKKSERCVGMVVFAGGGLAFRPRPLATGTR